MKKFLFLFISALAMQLPLAAQNRINGSWLGRLNAGALSLRLVFNISGTGNDSLSATLDSPDQGAKNIKLGKVVFIDDSLKIYAPQMLAEYRGMMKNDTLIEGIWKQAGQSFNVDLVKLESVFTINRPQEPKPPYPYSSEEVVFHNESANIDLAGTLTVPSGKGPFTAVVMITGSGQQNRDEELMGHKPFMVIADYLTRNGIAVLRFDDRGAGKSKGNPATATSADFATDAEAAVSFLRKDNRLNPESIGLIGHSEGGLIAPIVASSDMKIAFIVSLAGPGVPGDQIIFRQSEDISRASGIDEKEIKRSVEANRRLFPVLKKEKDNNEASRKMTEEYKKILMKEKVSPAETEKELAQFQASMNPSSLTWLRYFVSTDPSVYWKKVKCPVLALNGEKDLQVAAEVNLPAIGKALKAGGNTSVNTVKLPGLNHLFQHTDTGLPSEYGSIEETFSEEALKIIAEWIKNH